MLAAVIASLLICGGLLVYGSGRGWDLTDESFYLIWTRDPHAYALLYQPFGYVLHPLFVLVRGDLQLYRLTGFAAAAGAGSFVGYSLGRGSRTPALFALQGAASALTMFFPWIITLSYNSLADIGALLIVGGILNARAERPASLALGAFAAAAGLCLAAFAKPPLFAVSVAVMLVAAGVERSARAALWLIAALVLAAILISLFLAPTEIPRLVERILVSQHILALPNTPLALPGKIARDWLAVPPLLTGAAIAAGLSFALRRSRVFKWAGYAAVALSLWFIAGVVGDAIDGEIPDFLGLALLTTAAGYAGVLQHERQPSRLAIALLLGAPVAVALGTFNNQWFQLNFSLPFAFLALFVLALADPRKWRRGAACLLSTAGPVAVMLLAASAPYSLPDSIFEQQVRVEHPLARGSVLVDDETATFVEAAAGRARGALLIDLSGTGPGVAAVLGGRAPVLPWLNPATPEWADVVWSRLDAQQRETAWFVVPIWPLFSRSLPARWLAAHKPQFCRTTLPPMTFWGEERTLEAWRPCPNSRQRLGAPNPAYAQPDRNGISVQDWR